ncbi:MAG TPA: 23S rRNA (pseudouridine(1915)-N(3))-methyltransferase RlmH, partial [Tahibacter sp.]|nr:23S rRNA (pseudouridine(1915)-N(3))-methyltransferase RlmH [Tahibacter sp.]
ELPLELVELRLGERGKGRDLARALEDEGTAMLAAIPRGSHVIALDGRGKTWSSEDLATQLASWRMAGRDLVFLIGGPDGLASAALARADQRFSLGALTLPHMLVRLVLAEQLYRAVSLLGNHPYHRA